MFYMCVCLPVYVCILNNCFLFTSWHDIHNHIMSFHTNYSTLTYYNNPDLAIPGLTGRWSVFDTSSQRWSRIGKLPATWHTVIKSLAMEQGASWFSKQLFSSTLFFPPYQAFSNQLVRILVCCSVSSDSIMSLGLPWLRLMTHDSDSWPTELTVTKRLTVKQLLNHQLPLETRGAKNNSKLRTSAVYIVAAILKKFRQRNFAQFGLPSSCSSNRDARRLCQPSHRLQMASRTFDGQTMNGQLKGFNLTKK